MSGRVIDSKLDFHNNQGKKPYREAEESNALNNANKVEEGFTHMINRSEDGSKITTCSR
jgi:hypothetical protein